MGCHLSGPERRNNTSRAGSGLGSAADGGTENGAKPHPAIQNRISSIKETKTASFGGITVRYAYVSQRGYYPDDPDKANQDAFSVKLNFGEESTDSFLAVFDGHGRDGDRCAHFARDNLPTLVEKFVKLSKSREAKLLQIRSDETTKTTPKLELTKEQIQSALLKAHLECNRNMHRAQNFDDSLSGTTAISAYVHGRRNRITISNVGDSRAILGVKDPKTNSLKAMPLSRDQTPYRRDERVRVRKAGARILSLDQIEGLEPIDDNEDDYTSDLELGEELDEVGDPPRVWSPVGDYPGTAFTRSLGDAIAEELGVFAEPEMLTRELTRDDKILVLASDGVFEFLTNQSVIDMCAKFSDPLEACRAVVAESYELWLQYELRTDDITMICLFVDGVEEVPRDSFISASSRTSFTGSDPGALAAAAAAGVLPNAELEQSEPGDDTADSITLTSEASCRPVRLQISKEKSESIRKTQIKMTPDLTASTEEADLSKLYTKKTTEEESRIAEAIRASVMFQNITDAEREMIFGVMEPIKVKKGTWVIKQGTVGDRFYIVDTGRFEVRIVPEGEEDDGSGGNAVHVYEGSVERHAHPSFGELALMYSAPRAASIIAQTDGHLWALHRYAFRQVLAQQSTRRELIQTLKRMDAFSKLKPDDICNLAASMKEVTFGRGECIVTQGRSGDTMYVILSGLCEYVEKRDGEARASNLKSGDHFGEEVLVDDCQYGATVVAQQTTCCWKLDKAILKRTIGSRNQPSKSDKNVTK